MSALYSRAVRSEFRKTFSTRTVFGLAIAAATIPNLGSLGPLLSIGKAGGADISTPEMVRQSINVAFAASLFSVIMGVLLATTEVRHGTLPQTLIGEPDRRRLLMAKATAALALGLAFGAIGTVSATVTGALILHSKGVEVPLTGGRYLLMYAGSVLLGGMAGVWGLAIGTLVRNQLVAVTGVVVYTVFVEGPFISSFRTVGQWLPGGAQASMVLDLSLKTLPQLAGVGLFAAYILALAAAACARFERADVA